jgi:hypothetical protein
MVVPVVFGSETLGTVPRGLDTQPPFPCQGLRAWDHQHQLIRSAFTFLGLRSLAYKHESSTSMVLKFKCQMIIPQISLKENVPVKCKSWQSVFPVTETALS